MVSFEKKALLLIIAIALILRFAPVALYGMPLNYDNPYHVRMSEIILETNSLPETDPALGGRPYTYPPFYHVILASLSDFTGLEPYLLVQILLPFVAVLVVLSVYIIVRNSMGVRSALYAALFIALGSSLILAAYNSPENMVFFLLPASLFLFFQKKEKTAAALFALNLFWNYLAFAVTVIPLYIAFARKKRVLAYTTLAIVVLLAFWLFIYGFEALASESVTFGTEFVANNLKSIMPGLVINLLIVVIPIILYSANKLKTINARYWFSYSMISFAALLSYFATPIFRSWEQPKFMELGLITLIFSIKKRKAFKMVYVLAVGLILLYFSLLVSFQVVYPKVTQLDLHAIDWLEARGPEGRILTDPTFSEEIMNRTNLDDKLITALNFEATSEASLAATGFAYLSDKTLPDEENALKRINLQFLLFNFEDDAIRGTEEFAEKPFWDKVYSLNYFQNCPFYKWPVTQGFACGWLETKVLQRNN